MPAFKFLSSEPPLPNVFQKVKAVEQSHNEPSGTTHVNAQPMAFQFDPLFNPFGGLLNKKAHIAFNPPMGDNSLLKPVYQGLRPVLQGRLIGCLRWMWPKR
jgi:hypothetical protein